MIKKKKKKKSVTKSIISISLDNEIVELAHAKGLNLSGEINEYLKMRLVIDIPIEDNKIEILTKSIGETENRLISLKKQLNDTTETKEAISTKLSEQKQKELEELTR